MHNLIALKNVKIYIKFYRLSYPAHCTTQLPIRTG